MQNVSTRNHVKVNWKGFYDECLHSQCDKIDVVSGLFSKHIDDILFKRGLLVHFFTFTAYKNFLHK